MQVRRVRTGLNIHSQSVDGIAGVKQFYRGVIMETGFRLKTISQALCIAFPMFALPAIAAEPYPALPPTLSTSVAPNVMLYIDTSGSMLQDENNQWMRLDLCNSNANWSNCVNNNTNYRNTIDSETLSPNTKMNIAKGIAKELVDNPNNYGLRMGLFTFHDNKTNIGGDERAEGAKLRYEISDMNVGANRTALKTAISNVWGRTATPLGEGLLEVTRYFEGKSSMYSKLSNGTVYNSPIQYRCQKNFVVVLTDGDATGEDNLPGSGKNALTYTARDENGVAIPNQSFSVCTAANTTAANNISVNCPARLEGAAADAGFGDGTNRFRALRDVAKYARIADLKIGSNDNDGKSYDDPKFALQNLTTYTVAFGVVNDVLPAAATVGGGKNYTTQTKQQLSDALANAFASIAASTSNAGGVAALSEFSVAGNKIFQPVFNPNGWYGELRCYTLNTAASNGIGDACTPNAKAVIPAYGERKIWSNRVGGLTTPPYAATTTSFEFNVANINQLTESQKVALGSTLTEQQNVINFLRGDETIDGFRRRPNGLLGDIIDGQPTVISAPSGETPDTAYQTFKTDNSTRNIALIGANDGMLHAFDIANMTEVMAYIPSAVYPRLKGLKETNYGEPTGTPHAYHVNGGARQADVKLGVVNGTGGAWKTVFAGALGQGGQGYHVINATSKSSLADSSPVMWEWTDISDSDMGYSFPTPLIYNVRMSSTTVVPAVILANGYENSWDDTGAGSGGQKTTANSSALYVVNANTGALIKKISVSGGVGLSTPAGVDFGQDGILDYVYAGDMNGKLWRFDLTNDDPAQFSVATNPIFDAGVNQPITIRPAIKPVTRYDGTSVGNLVVFGTGKLLTDADRSSTTTQSFYAVMDVMASSPTTVLKTQLKQRTVVDEKTVIATTEYRGGDYRKISVTPEDETEIDLTSAANTWKGWYLDLPASSERLVTSPLLVDDKLLFGTGIPLASEKCLPGGKGWIMGLDPMTGSVTKSSRGKAFSFVDVKMDGKSNDADKVTFATGTAFVSGFSKDGIPTELTYVANGSRIVTTGTSDSGFGDAGAVIAMKEANSMAVYTGNAADGVKTGNPIGRPAPSGGGKIISGKVGSDEVKSDEGPPPSSGIKVETSTWREIK